MGPSRYVAERSRNMRAGVRVAYAASLAVVVGVASSVFTAWQAAMLVGWDAGALLLILWIWIAVAGLLRIARIRGLIDQHLRSRWACEGQVAICHGRYRAGVLLWFRPSPSQGSTLDSPAPVTSLLGVARPDEFGMRIVWLVSSGPQRLEREVTGNATLTDDRLSSSSTDPGRQAGVVETRTPIDISAPDETAIWGIDEPRRSNVGRVGVSPGTDVPVLNLADVRSQVRATLFPGRNHRRCHHRGAERIDRPSGDTCDGQELR